MLVRTWRKWEFLILLPHPYRELIRCLSVLNAPEREEIFHRHLHPPAHLILRFIQDPYWGNYYRRVNAGGRV